MATPAGADALRLAGDIRFLAGGLRTDDLIGAFVKDISSAGVVTLQMSDGSEVTRDVGVSTGLETYTLPSKTSTSAGAGAIAILNYTLAEIQAVDSEFDAPTGEFLLSAALADHSVFQVVHAGWDATNNRVQVFLKHVASGGNQAYTGTVTLTVLRGSVAPGGGANPVAVRDALSTLIGDQRFSAEHVKDIGPATIEAGNAALKKAWREILLAARITVGNTLPGAAETNVGDVHVFTLPVLDGLAWRDIADQSTVIDSAQAGDIGLYLTGLGWVRVGNVLSGGGGGTDETARMAAAAAAEAAQEAIGGVVSNSGRLADVEHRTSDIDAVVAGSTWGAAPAAEAQITVIAPTNSLRAAILDRSFDPANLAGDEVWANAVNTTAENDIVLLRLRDGLDNIRYRYTSGGAPEPILANARLPNGDDTWTYYSLGQFASGLAVVLQKRVDVFHTQYKGELAGRALEQVEDAIEAHEPPRTITFDPPVWGKSEHARTFLVTLNNFRATPALARVDKIRMTIQGSILGTIGWTFATGPRVLAFPLAAGPALDNISNNSIGETVLGTLTFHATGGAAAASSNQVDQIPFSLEIVAPADVPTPGSSTVVIEHPRVFHALASATPDPSDNTRVSIDFTPNEAGLTPVANSLFTFTWNVNPNLSLYRATMAPRGTPSADATVVSLADRASSGSISNSSDLVSGTTYLARFGGAGIVILTQLQDAPESEGGGSSGVGAGRSNVILAPIAGADEAGATSVVLPADFATYKTLSLGFWDNSQNRTTALDFATALLAAQDSTPAGFSGLAAGFLQIGWDSSTRTLTLPGGANGDAFLFAELHDGAGNNLLIDNPAAPIPASAENSGMLLYRAGRLYRNEHLHYADPTATYRDFTTSDLPEGFTWGGAVQINPSPSSVLDNRVIYSIPAGRAERKITGGGRAWWVAYTLPNWRGPFADESAADGVVTAVGQTVYFGGKVQVVATYTPRQPDRYHWVPLEKRRFEAPIGASPAVLPEGTHTVHVVWRDKDRAADIWSKGFNLSTDFAATSRDLNVDSSNPKDHAGDQTQEGNNVRLIATYVAATRTLTYASGHANFPLVSITAIGEA